MVSVNAVLVSCDPGSAAFALAELGPLVAAPLPITWLDDGTGLLDIREAFPAFSERLERQGSIFIRHLAPVQLRVELHGDETDLQTLRESVLLLQSRFDACRTFAVQSRIIGEGKLPYRRFTLNQALSDALAERTGATLETRSPEQIVSILCTPQQGFLGVSLTAQNRSAWPGGAHRFQREEGQISRAEFKLLEALSVFDLALPYQGVALDMGAAPGGWTRVLRQHHLKVIAVDPADLDPRLRSDRGITHVRTLIQDYLRNAPLFDVLVNDMRMDAADSVEIMLQAQKHLKPQGIALVTLKLPEEVRNAWRNPEVVQFALQRLASRFHVIGARQLYHNRSEATVALKNKETAIDEARIS